MKNLLNLSQEDYLNLSNMSSSLIRDDGKAAWFESSHDYFINHKLESIKDLIEVIAYAYSWMPTIPKINFKRFAQFDELKEEILDLQNGDLSTRAGILKILIPLINNSEIGTSKVLYFLAPQIAPIFDRRVRVGWNVFFKGRTDIPRMPESPTINGLQNKIYQYLAYWDYLLDWQKELKNVSLRDIENKFFLLGSK